MAQLQPNPATLRLLYFRPRATPCNALDEKLFDLATRYRDRCRLVVRHSDERGPLLGGWISGEAPTVLFVRNGQTVAQIVGDLPMHEIEFLLLRSASSSAARAA
jgi:thioredoxin-like negative regulator of GroEL